MSETNALLSQTSPDTAVCVVERARLAGASLAGIASADALRDSPSHRTQGKVEWPAQARSVLVLALAHAKSEPELDWWGIVGGTKGNRRLQEIAKRLKRELKREFDIAARPLPYSPARGGAFLKDAAALAGLGIIGANNLLVTPEFGPRIRLRALLVDAELSPTGPMGYAPCDACDRPCQRACPQKAFASGSYVKALCTLQMQRDEATAVTYVKYCRACELACPVGSQG